MQMLALTVAVWVCACFASVSHGSCVSDVRLGFKKAQSSGIRSFVTEPNQPLVVGVQLALPTIILETRENQDLDKTLDGNTVQVVMEPVLRLGGKSVELNQGQALFTSLTVQEVPDAATTYVMVFSVQTENTSLSVRTGKVDFRDVTASALTNIAFIDFREQGFFYRAGQTRTIPVNAAIPTFWIVAKNIFGQAISPSALSPTLSIQATTTAGSLTTASSSSTIFTGKQNIEISTLVFKSSDENDMPSLKFSLTSSIFVSTDQLTPIFETVRNRFINFVPSSSFFAYENIGNTAVLGLAMPPIVIQLYTSSMESDVSNTGLVIQATTEQGTLEGAEALVVRGVATFSNLAFVGTAPRSSVITFTAGTQGGLPVQQYSLSSGAVSVAITAIKAKHFSFAQSSFIQSTEQRSVRLDTATGTFVIPSIIVQMKDSAYQIDSTVNNLGVSVSLEPPNRRHSNAGHVCIQWYGSIHQPRFHRCLATIRSCSVA